MKYILTRDGVTGVILPTRYDKDDHHEATTYTASAAMHMAETLNRLEDRFPGLQVGLPEEYIAYQEYCGGVGHAVINTEEGENGAYLDYYERYDNEELSDLLEGHDLYVEWCNAAVAVIYPV